MATNNAENDRRIDYVEFDVTDVARAKKFYGDVFGWTFKDYGPDYCEFRDGRLTGGFVGAGKTRGAGGPLVILYANDLSDIQRRIEAAAASTSPIRMATNWRCGRHAPASAPVR